MNWITDLFNHISKIFQWWVIVLPWETGIRIRAGKYQTMLTKGVYLKLPIIDNVFIVSTRLRYVGLPMQTLTTKDGFSISLSGTVGYIIRDVEKLYNTIYSPTSTITSMALSQIASHCALNELIECTPWKIEMSCTNKMDLAKHGLGDFEVKIIGYAVVKTYRLIQDQSWFQTEKQHE